jgi:gliding motility-associated-like protein
MRAAFIILFFFFCTQSSAQELVWAKHLAGKGTSTPSNITPGTSVCSSIAVDMENNVYITGYLNDSVDVDPGTNELFLRGGDDDIYLGKYSEGGDLLWAHAFPSAGWNYATNVEVDNENNIIISGHGNNSADFDPGPGTLIVGPAPGHANFFYMAKYTPAGALIWARSIGNSFGVMSFDMEIDRSTNTILVTGNFYNTVDFDPDSTVASLSSNGSGVFFAKYDAAGKYLWARHLSGVGMYGGASAISCSDNGNVFVAGYFGNTVDFDPGPVSQTITASTTAERFFAKYDSNGNYIWAKAINMNDNGVFAVGRDCRLAVDSDENLYFTGNYKGTVDFDPNAPQAILTASPGGYSAYLCKYDVSGNLAWAKSINANSCYVTGIELDCERNIYLTGSFTVADFDPSPLTEVLMSNAPSAFMNFFAKYDAGGNYLWAKMIGNNGYGGSTIPSALAVKDHHQYIGGCFKQSGDFDPGPGTKTLTASGVGANTFFAKYRSTDSTNTFAFDLGNDTSICMGSSLVLHPASNGMGYVWNDHTIAPQYTISQEGTYWVKTVIRNCTVSDTIQVKTELCGETLLEMPNVFSPNGDGMNDLFVPVKMKNVRDARLTIFNRWGQKLFETTTIEYGWNGKFNGKESEDGTYYWILDYTFLTNESNSSKGYLTLIR